MQRLMLYNMLDLFSLKLNKMDRKFCNTILRFIWSMNQFNFSSSEYWILDKPSPPSKWKEIFINRALPPLTTCRLIRGPFPMTFTRGWAWQARFAWPHRSKKGRFPRREEFPAFLQVLRSWKEGEGEIKARGRACSGLN